jgi:antitoxin Phd
MPGAHTFRNRKGELVSIPEIPASKAKASFGEVLEQVVVTGGVAITRHNVPKAVVLSWEEFVSLNGSRTESLSSLADQFEGLLASMQGSRAQAAMERAFDASPEQLGRAAVAAAHPRPRRAAAARRKRRP